MLQDRHVILSGKMANDIILQLSINS